MTDFSAEMNVGAMERVGVPSQLIGGDRPASIEAKKTFHVSPAENDVNNPGSTVRFTLPNQPNTYLMPNVEFTFTAALGGVAADAGNFDNNASAVIERYRLYHGSQLLVDIPEYARLRKLVGDVTQSPVNGSTITNLLENAPDGSADPGDAAAIVAAKCSAVPQTQVDFMAGASRHHMVVPLMCPVIGSMAQKAWPCHAATAAPLRIEIDLTENAKALLAANGRAGADPTYTIDHTQLKAEYVQVSSNAQALIDQAVGGVYSLNTSSYAHTQSTVATGSTTANLLLPFSYSSLKHFVTGLYKQGSSVDDFNISGRNRANIDQVFYQIGAARVPSTPMSTDKEVGAQLCKCFGVSSDLLQICNYLERDTFNTVATAVTPAAGAYIRQGTFAMGIDLEAFGATSSASRIENGVNTTALQCFINFTTQAGQTFGANYDVHSWASYDMLVTFANGQGYARF
jgi:hypothetical protein